jgi:hypothetical protein
MVAGPEERVPGPALFLLSFSLLTLEVFQTKAFSYSLATLLLYAVFALALAGLGAGATLVSLAPALDPARRRRFAAAATLGFAATIVPVHAFFCRKVPDLPLTFSLDLLLLAAGLTLPYLLAGCALALLLLGSGRRVHAAYGWNLLGSGAGCFTVFLLLRPLGGEAFVAATAGLGAIAGLALAWDLGRGWRMASVLVLGACAATLIRPTALFRFPPEPYGQLDQAQRMGRQHDVEVALEFDEWDPTGRIQVHSFRGVPGYRGRPYPYRLYTQDSSAGSFLIDRRSGDEGLPKFLEKTLYRQAYYRPGLEPDVLVIGLGGGPDLLAALHHGARSVVGVEINGATVRMGRGPMDGFLGGFWNDPRVTVVHGDGRAYTATTGKTFDVLQMSGVDTKQLMAAGSLAINECYLYTVEAFRTYFARLKPDGVISAIRFGPTDMTRFATIAVAALRELGARAPERHFVVLEAGKLAGILVKREPFRDEELDRLVSIYPADAPAEVGPKIVFLDAFHIGFAPAPRIRWMPGRVAEEPYRGLFGAVQAGTLDAWLAAQEEDWSPTTDAKPFYFDRARYFRSGVPLPPHLRFLGAVLLTLAALALALILLPVAVFRARQLATPGIGRSILYFSALGLAYLWAEIGLIHHFSIFLGHQTYSFTVVIFALLVGSALGSFASARLVGGRAGRFRFALLALGALLVVLEVGLAQWLAPLAGAPLATRIAVAAAFVAPAGFVMGMPFPTGLAAVRERAPHAVPWAIAINGALSVLASTMAVPLSLMAGFPVLMAGAAALYVAAAFLLRFPDPSPSPA